MKLLKFLNESNITKALGFENPDPGKEYIKENVIKTIKIVDKAIVEQREKTKLTDDEVDQSVLDDLLLKLRKWLDLFEERWPDESVVITSDLAPVAAKPAQAPVSPDAALPFDLANKLAGNEPIEPEKEEKK